MKLQRGRDDTHCMNGRATSNSPRDPRRNGEEAAVAASACSPALARPVIECWRLDYHHVRPHSAHGGLTPDAVWLNPAPGQLRNLISSTGRPLPPAREINHHPLDCHKDRETRGGHVTISGVHGG
ncbi:MAG: integrase core domain-containing protein [Brevundimonas sp.]|uniref:integrase core domain-containing protein n=2 Tax=Brevundimonas sp. TaxID=1871086 RepID=UPI00391B7E87